MRKLFATLQKELIILIRDLPGLSILFIMPVILIIVVSLTQQKAVGEKKESKFTLLYCDNDTSLLSQAIENGLKASRHFVVKNKLNEEYLDEEKVKQLVNLGEYQVGVIIPSGTYSKAITASNRTVKNILAVNRISSDSLSGKEKLPEILLYLDPVIIESFKTSIVSSLNGIIRTAEIKIISDNFSDAFRMELNDELQNLKNQIIQKLKKQIVAYAPRQLSRSISKEIENNLNKELDLKLSAKSFTWNFAEIIKVKESSTKEPSAESTPTVVQHNVPAYSLFAMFFIVIPLAGSLITEKNSGTFFRLKTLPTSYYTIMLGKILVYTLVCLIQLVLMICVGVYILPIFFGMPALVIGSNYGAILLAAFASAFAAIGFGTLVGTLAKTHPQAAMFGSVMTVILGILGGIMMPIYVMPQLLKTLSIISPIRWGMETFLDIFVRGAGIVGIMPNVIRLILFFCIAQAVSLFAFIRRN